MKPALSVLTDPMLHGMYRWKELAKRLARPIRRAIAPGPEYRRRQVYRGHPAVTRSLIEGLRKIGVNATYNPTSISELSDTLLVLSGTATLQQAIEWKRAGRITRLLAGPNILVFPSEYPELIAAKEVDCCITPSPWVSRLYEEDCQALKGKCSAWPAGVDTEYWSPMPQSRHPRQVLIYDKVSAKREDAMSEYVKVLESRNYEVSNISYGSYVPEQYLAELRKSSLLVGFSTNESQGIAWAEAWAVDVPTILWFQDHSEYQGRRFSNSSTAPYLTDSTGLFFSDVSSFQQALDRWETASTAFNPRSWVLENMSDEASARQLCRLAGVG
jgi:hypothetical protein